MPKSHLFRPAEYAAEWRQYTSTQFASPFYTRDGFIYIFGTSVMLFDDNLAQKIEKAPLVWIKKLKFTKFIDFCHFGADFRPVF